jgi:lysophospholipase L1-like esterase
MASNTLLLLGDSILDNAPYTSPEPDTAAHLRALVGAEWAVELLARDGATMRDMQQQLDRIISPAATSFLSIGGNDLIPYIGLLSRQAVDAPDIFAELLQIAENFAQLYEQVASMLAMRVERAVLCTIYEVRLEPHLFAQLARVPLAVFNDRIVRTAARLGLEVLELRDVCTERSDFVRQIEPSAQGARKIAAAIAAVVQGHMQLRTGRIHSIT